ncbi:MAG: dUTP pyrophosphatase [Chitinophagaceae bacterium]|nr:MAG: dUTP pyrophosphatase [Chitinophagaceae bacterium]
MSDAIIYFAKCFDNAIVPSKRKEDAGFDLYACFEEREIIIEPGDIKLIPTGISTAFSNKYVLFVKERSSTGSIGMAVRMGVVDSGYRGEIKIGINNTTKKTIIISKEVEQVVHTDTTVHFPFSKAIAQAVLLVIPQVESETIDRESLLKIESERGTSFLGASGK